MSVPCACMCRHSSMTVANGSWCQTLGEGSLDGHAWRATVGDLGEIPRTQAGKESGQRGFHLIHSSLKLQEIHTQKKGPKN